MCGETYGLLLLVQEEGHLQNCLIQMIETFTHCVAQQMLQATHEDTDMEKTEAEKVFYKQCFMMKEVDRIYWHESSQQNS